MFKTIMLYIKFLRYKLNKVYSRPYNENYDNYLNEQLMKLDDAVVKYQFGTILIDNKWVIIDCNNYYGAISGEVVKYTFRPSIKTMVKLEKLAEKSRIADYEKNKPAYLKRKIDD